MTWSGRPVDRRGFSHPWWRDPHRVDGYQAGGVQWPMETSRFSYVAPFGGFAEDIHPGRVGLHHQAIEENTELEPGDTVTVSVFEGNRPVPLLIQPTFELVPLDFGTPDAFLHSTAGEAVLSVEDTDRELPGLEDLSSELRVVLNGVLAARMRRGS